MGQQELKTFVLLRSERFVLPDEAAADFADPPGRDLALFLMQALASEGFSPLPDVPVSGSDGWSWDIEIQETRFGLFVHWAPIGDPPTDCWVIQTELRRGPIRNLFGPAVRPAELSPLCEILHRALDGNPAFSSVEWLTTDEFRSVY